MGNGTAAGVESQVEIRILLDSLGDELSTSFTLNFSPFGPRNPVVALGNDMLPGSTLQINNDNLAQGQLGIVINSPRPFAVGTHNILNIRFTVLASVSVGGYPVCFGGVPTPQNVSSPTGMSLPTTYEPGFIALGQADGIGVGGRVLTPDGRGLGNVTVIATDAFGSRRFATTNSFGNYLLPYVRLGRTYTLSVQSKRYRFKPLVFQVAFPLPDFDFIGLE